MAIRFLDGKLYADMFRGGANMLRNESQTVNNLNVFPVPDGDTGDNMSMTMDGGMHALSSSDGLTLGEMSQKIAQGMLLGARGNSGVILSQLFAGMAKVFKGLEKADINIVGEALKTGVKQAYGAVRVPTEGTILTVAREGVDHAVKRINSSSTLETLFADLVKEMDASLKRTPEILEILMEAGVVDSGGAGLLYIMQGFNTVLTGGTVELTGTPVASPSAGAPIDFATAFNADSELTYGYCTEVLLQLQNSKTDVEGFDVNELSDYLATIGDSIVAFKTGSIVKIHVHTKTPDAVLAYGRKFGEFLTVKIENMSVQHNESIAEEKQGEPKAAKKKKMHKKYGVVTVAGGDGIKRLFKELGADYVVNGGQTMNPSAQDFVDAFDYVDADVIYVLPNNSNIILAASQASKIYKDSRIIVIESTSLGDGYAVMSALNFECDDPDEIAEMLREAMRQVVTGSLTTATRNVTLNGIDICANDYIGFIGKTMIASDKDKLTTAKELVKGMNMDEKYALTVFCGKDATEDESNALSDELTELYPDLDIFFISGDQDIYDFIFVSE